MTRDTLQDIVTSITSKVADDEKLDWLQTHAIGGEIGTALRTAGATDGEIASWVGDCLNVARRQRERHAVDYVIALAEGAGFEVAIDDRKHRITMKHLTIQ